MTEGYIRGSVRSTSTLHGCSAELKVMRPIPNIDACYGMSLVAYAVQPVWRGQLKPEHVYIACNSSSGVFDASIPLVSIALDRGEMIVGILPRWLIVRTGAARRKSGRPGMNVSR